MSSLATLSPPPRRRSACSVATESFDGSASRALIVALRSWRRRRTPTAPITPLASNTAAPRPPSDVVDVRASSTVTTASGGEVGGAFTVASADRLPEAWRGARSATTTEGTTTAVGTTTSGTTTSGTTTAGPGDGSVGDVGDVAVDSESGDSAAGGVSTGGGENTSGTINCHPVRIRFGSSKTRPANSRP